MTAAPNPDLKAHARAAVRQNLSAFHPLPALYPLPALALALAAGLVSGRAGPTLLVAAGAFSAGFGAFQRVSRFHIAPMLLAALCMAVSTTLGAALSVHGWLYLGALAVTAATLGLAASFGTGPWWVLLQGAIFLVINGSQPAGLGEALARGLLVLGGGVVQSLSVAALRTLAPRGFPPLSAPNAVAPPESAAAWAAKAREVFRWNAPEVRYAVLLGLATAAATLIQRSLGLAHGYWMAMTVLLVLRRGGAETVTRGVQRIAGTLLGAGTATLIAALLRPDPWTLVALITLAAWCAYAVQWVNYGTFAISVTSYVAFLLALEGLPERAVAGERVAATLLGGLLGIVALGLAKIGGRAVRVTR
jgi:hypothetical protein